MCEELKSHIEQANTFWIKEHSVRLGFLYYVFNNYKDDLVQSIIKYEGERNTGSYGGGYCELCSSVWDKATRHDSGSSYAYHESMKFVSESILYVDKYVKNKMTKEKRLRIQAIEKEKIRLSTELDELLESEKILATPTTKGDKA
jgi:hypothetical protein